ncbi:hypothetical protein FACS1894208_06830 [Clostridia bacterium]|nr:hypothetical protein FACS1894208_06830 [Clostridia bacterium]
MDYNYDLPSWGTLATDKDGNTVHLELTDADEIKTSRDPNSDHFGKYANLHRTYLKEHQPERWTAMLSAGKLCAQLDLDNIQRDAEKLLDSVMSGLLSRNPPPQAGTLEWTRHMNMLKAQAEEAVLNDIVYA